MIWGRGREVDPTCRHGSLHANDLHCPTPHLGLDWPCQSGEATLPTGHAYVGVEVLVAQRGCGPGDVHPATVAHRWVTGDVVLDARCRPDGVWSPPDRQFCRADVSRSPTSWALGGRRRASVAKGPPSRSSWLTEGEEPVRNQGPRRLKGSRRSEKCGRCRRNSVPIASLVGLGKV